MAEITYTFATGRAAKLRPVPVGLFEALKKKFPPPTPPVYKTPEGITDINPDDPDYKKALADWDLLFEDKKIALYLQMGIDIEIDRSALDQTRAFMKDNFDIDLYPENDKLAYIMGVCCGNGLDYQKLLKAIIEAGSPTEEAIQERIADFRS